MHMTPNRRTFLRAAVLAAGITATVTATGAPSAYADDEYDTLRRRWLVLALGAGYDPTAEPYASRLRRTGELARGYRATMAPAAASLWPGHPFDPPDRKSVV